MKIFLYSYEINAYQPILFSKVLYTFMTTATNIQQLTIGQILYKYLICVSIQLLKDTIALNMLLISTCRSQCEQNIGLMALWPNPAQFFFYFGGEIQAGYPCKTQLAAATPGASTVPNAQHIEFINFIVPYLPPTYYNQENTHLFVL